MKSDPDKDSILGDLLGHYSSRAVAHASFFIASIFGVVTFSAIVQQLNQSIVPFLISVVLFLGFSYAGYFTLLRFGYYADLANKIAMMALHQDEILESIELPESERVSDRSIVNLSQYFKTKTTRLDQYLLFKVIVNKIGSKLSNVLLGFGYWVGIFLLGLVAYEKFFAVSLWLYNLLFGILFMLTLLLVILPVIIRAR